MSDTDFLVAVPGTTNHITGMAETLQERVGELERKVAVLTARVLDLRPRRKDWRRTVGSMTDDEVAREAERLGREYRQEHCDGFEQRVATGHATA
jgi:predicted  nucleic acid-binding Zn-ribbon protein